MTEEMTMILNSKLANKAIETYGNAEDALKQFRKSIKTRGYYGIEKWMMPLVEEYGDIRDVCFLIFTGYYDADASHRITDLEYEALYGLTQIDDDLKEHYDLYRKAYMTLRESLFMYRSSKRQMFSLFHMMESDIVYYESAERMERFANATTLRFVDDVLMDEYVTELEAEAERINNEGSLIKAEVTEDGQLKLDYKEQLGVIGYQVRLITDEAKRCKGYLDAVINWVTAMDLYEILPMEYRYDQQHLEDDFYIKTIAPRWYKTSLKGEEASAQDKKLALIPSFKSIRKNKKSYDVMSQRLNYDYGRL